MTIFAQVKAKREDLASQLTCRFACEKLLARVGWLQRDDHNARTADNFGG
jgi:hypothetical protein